MPDIRTENTSYIGKEFLPKGANTASIRHDFFNAPAAASATAILSAHALDGSTVTTFAAQPDVARNAQIVASGAATGNVVLNGTNIRGETITETLALNGATPVVGNKAFKSYTSIVLPTVAATTINIGTDTKLGLDRTMDSNGVFLATVDGAADSALPTVAFSATAVESNTVILATAPNGTHAYYVTFITTEAYTQG